MSGRKTKGKEHAKQILPDCRCAIHVRYMLGKKRSDCWNRGLTKETDLSVAAVSNAMAGRKFSKQHRLAISEARKGKTSGSRKCIDGCVCGRHDSTEYKRWWKNLSIDKQHKIISKLHSGWVTRQPSKLAWKAADCLLKDFDVVIPEVQFGPYTVDFLLAEEWLGIEIDGAYWHKINKTDYDERDKYLLKQHGLPIVRISETEVKEMFNGK